jgi:hypothetical protein
VRTSEEIHADATPGAAFSNSTMFEMWSPRWCDSCAHDDETTETYCPILTVSLLGVTPREWTAVDRTCGDYTCSEFEQGVECPHCVEAEGLSVEGLIRHLKDRHSEKDIDVDEPPVELPGQMGLF